MSGSLAQNCWHDQKGLVTRNVHMKYQRSRLPLMVQMLQQRFKFLEMYVKGHGKGIKVITLVSLERDSLVEHTCQI